MTPEETKRLVERLRNFDGSDIKQLYTQAADALEAMALNDGQKPSGDLPCASAGSSRQSVTDDAVAPDQISAAARDALAERRAQVTREGWTPEHDDAHSVGALAVAGACYAFSAASSQYARHSTYWARRYTEAFREYWPFDEEWRKPKDPRRDLVRAGALIIAEIERIDRAALQPDHEQALPGDEHE